MILFHFMFGRKSLLTSRLPEAYTQIVEYFGSKPFMQYEATGSLQFALSNAHDYEEAEFKKTVECVSFADVPPNANGISFHVIYKTKINDGNR